MATIATLCTGGGGVEVGAMAAGLTPLWGIEYDDEIADVACANGLHVITADVCEADPADYERPDVLHASPPCPNFSTANQGGEETGEDVAIAEAVARFVETLRPGVFTLENVYMYRKSQSWALIADTLNRCGYWYDLAHVNAADFGVPQTRRRMIVRARLGAWVPHLPPPEPWVGWYAAIEDLIPTLPESQFAPWQLARLPSELQETVVVGCGATGFERAEIWKGVYRTKEPYGTVPAQPAGGLPKAFILSNAKTEWGDGIRRGDEPSVAVTEQSNGRTRAFIVGSNSVDGSTPPTRTANEPALTVDTKTPGHLRAFLVTGQYAQSNDIAERSAQVRDEDIPSNTITASNKGDWRALLSQGRVVQMTPRALARFQSFPDWYKLPESRSLACKIIGNACPPLLMKKLYEQLCNYL